MKNKIAVLLMGSALAMAAPVVAQTPTTPTAPDATTTTPATPAPSTMPSSPTTTAPAATTPAAPMGAPAINVIVPEGYTVVSDWGVVTLDELKGADVHGPEGKKIGNVEDAELGGDGKISGIVADIGGFLGIGSHRALIGNDHAAVYKHSDGKVIVATDMTEDALKALPKYEKKS